MELNRRALLVAAGALGAGALVAGQANATVAAKPLRILVLGGTGFIGPHFVRLAQSRGHHLTLFNRGRSNVGMFPDATNLVGDRDNGLDVLNRGEWDVVLDNSGYVPRHVRDSALLLKGRVGRYVFTSSVAAFDFDKPDYPLGVGSALAPLAEPESENVGKYYGALKVVAEKIVNETYGDAATVVRPTYVAGPGDHTQRFTWWVQRIHAGGDILAPGNPQASFSLIDVRDLAQFYLALIEKDTPGTFNAAGPAGVLSWSGLLNGIRSTTSSAVRLHWASAQFLEKHQVDGRELPMWTDGGGFSGELYELQTAVAAGLSYTPLAVTTLDTLEWYLRQSMEQRKFTRAGLAPDKEKRVLAALMG